MNMADEDSFLMLKMEFFTMLENLLKSGEYEVALQKINQTSNNSILVTESLDLIPVVCRYLTSDPTNDSTELIDCCEEILLKLAVEGNPKELLIGLLEQAESPVDDLKFTTLLKPIQVVLQRLPGKRGKSLVWALEVVHSKIKSLTVPPSHNLEDDERMLLDFDANTIAIAKILSATVSFYGPFVRDISLESKRNENTMYKQRLSYQRDLLTKFLLLLLDHPLAYLNLCHKNGTAKSEIRFIVEKIVYFIKQLQSNFFKLLDYRQKNNGTKREDPADDSNSQINKPVEDSKKDGIDADNVSLVSVATFFYLIFAENIEILHLPQIYSHIYKVEVCLPLCNVLLTNTCDFTVHKGLLLGDYLIKILPIKELKMQVLDISDYRLFAQNLINIMIFSAVQEYRTFAVKSLQEYISKFEYLGRYHLLKRLLASNNHAGLQGLLIQIIKNNIVESLQSEKTCCFTGSNLHAILQLIVPLNDGPTTDLLEQSDRILSSLNFIRFLALRDPAPQNATGIWNDVDLIECKLFMPLQKALDLSRAHYNLELKNLKEKGQADDPTKLLSIGSLPLPIMNSEQCFELLHSALNTFDVIDSVLARVSEIFNSGKQYVEMSG